MKKVVTIARQFGACGTTVGRSLANRLRYDLWNKAIVLNAQKNSNVDISDLVEFDEKVPTNFSFGQSLFEFSNKQLSDQIFAAQTEVIRKMGESGRCVIIGRNANYILKEFDNVLNVFIHADEEWRLAHMQDLKPDYTKEKMRERLKQVDRIREKYCTYYTHTAFTDAMNYDICLDVGKLGPDRVVDILYEIAVNT
jgi:cytidylate kinase